ncbi:restriction endonuclease subunit S [Antrihabitans spumae]|uniref:Restriction endonuclease subunit S n=1 Tax=Antrihabitans spumae TaxID=3373370 RepID=A0ABW7JX49_9NOCA
MSTVEDLFIIGRGHSLSLNKMRQVAEVHGVAFVSRTAKNNGVSAWVSPLEDVQPHPAGSLSVCLRSRNSTLATFVQPRRFYTAYHVATLTPRDPMTLAEKLWWARCIEENRYRLNFGRQANRTLSSLELPDVQPDWVRDSIVPTYEELGDSELVQDDLQRLMTSAAPISVSKIFQVGRGRTVLKREMRHGRTPYVGASGLNNGVTSWIDQKAQWLGGCVTIASNGDVGAAFYQSRDFCASSDVTILTPRFHAQPEDLLFIVTILRMEKFRWNYGRKWSSSKIAESTVLLPTDDRGDVNWYGIRKFISRYPIFSVIPFDGREDHDTTAAAMGRTSVRGV